MAKRNKSEVRDARRNGVGCCSNFADNMDCNCLAEAADDPLPSFAELLADVKRVNCGTCDGSGGSPYYGSDCPTCDGKGMIEMNAYELLTDDQRVKVLETEVQRLTRLLEQRSSPPASGTEVKEAYSWLT